MSLRAHVALALAAGFTFLAPQLASGQGLFEQAIKGDAPAPTSQSTSAPVAAPTRVESGVKGSLGGLGFEINGHLRGALYIGKVDARNAAETKAGYGEAGLKLRARKGSFADAFAELRFRAGLIDGKSDQLVDLREAYVNLYLGPVDLRLGHQIIVWGRADGVNPTNNLTPRDMRFRSPDEDDQRLANMALRAYLNLDPLRFEIVGVPFFRAAELPVFGDGSLPIAPPPGMSLELTEPYYPDANIRNGIGAARVHLLFPAFELSASYLIGTSTQPGIKLRQAPPDVVVSLAAYRHQVVGLDFSTTLFGLGLRGEAAYRRPFDYEASEHIPNPDLHFVLGVDRELFDGHVSVIAQYAGRVVFDWQDDAMRAMPPTDDPMLAMTLGLFLVPKNRMIASQLEQVQHAATFRAELKLLQETLRLELMGMGNFTTEELMVRPKVSYDIADALRVTAGAELYFGPDEALLGLMNTLYSAGYVELRASF